MKLTHNLKWLRCTRIRKSLPPCLWRLRTMIQDTTCFLCESRLPFSLLHPLPLSFCFSLLHTTYNLTLFFGTLRIWNYLSIGIFFLSSSLCYYSAPRTILICPSTEVLKYWRSKIIWYIISGSLMNGDDIHIQIECNVHFNVPFKNLQKTSYNCHHCVNI